MKIITLQGSVDEIGKQEAELYKHNSDHFNTQVHKNTLNQQLKVYLKHYPHLLKKYKVMAKCLKLPEKIVYQTFIVTDAQIKQNPNEKNSEKGCSIFGIRNKHGCFVGRNYDWSPNTNNYFKIFNVISYNTHSYIGISDMNVLPTSRKSLFFEPEDLINEKGLYIGLTFAYDNNWNFGLTPPHFMMLIAETCSTVNQALKLTAKTPLATPKNFFIADRHGHMAVVEHTSKEYKVILPEDNKLIHTNDYVNPILSKEDTVLKVRPDTDSYIRYYEILQFLNKNKNDIEYHSIFRFLNSKATHVFEYNKRLSTIWSLAMSMKRRRYKIGYHHKCRFRTQILKM